MLLQLFQLYHYYINIICSLFKPGERPQLPIVGRLWARAWFTEIISGKCVSVPIYLSTYLCPYALTHVSKPFQWQKQPLYKNYIQALNDLYTGKLLPKGGFHFWVDNRAQRPSTDFEASFPSRLFRHSTTENTVLGLIGTQEMHIYLVVWKVGVTHTYANENEEQS